MRHAGPAALDELSDLLEELRALPGVQEKSRGVFYRRSKAFLHFHEDPKGLFADVRGPDGEWERIEVTDAEARTAVLAAATRLTR
ncbi:hypothetical protein ACFODL_07625 [Phenylobacterium terrae]|uniref:Uncharacterized protein n=1 Tax=Phenylobacterium terrae TaxID=2665495 RepID=A0ABW4N4I0_9CAUL